MTLTLSKASGGHIDDDTATGTIENEAPLQQAWLARFGRTVAQRVLDGVQGRLDPPRESGVQATFAGHDLRGAGEVAAQVMVRGMVAHQTSGFRDWGVSGSLRFDPRPSSDRGPSVTLMPAWGASSSGGVERTRRESTVDTVAPEHRVMVRLALQ